MSKALTYPGKIPDPATQLWFEGAAEKAGLGPYVPGDGSENPCVRLHGLAEPAAKCKDCQLFIRKHYSKTYFKCALRGDTNGPATDHRANWPACGRFVPATNLTTDKH
jgi:hypothetical protein